MKRILTFIAVAILLCTTAFATVTSQNGILSITGETLQSVDTSIPMSTWSPFVSNSVDRESGYSYSAKYTISGRKATLSEAFCGCWCTSSNRTAGLFSSAQSGLRSTFSTIPCNTQRCYIQYPNGLQGISSNNVVEIKSNNNEHTILLNNVTSNTTVATSFYLVNTPAIVVLQDTAFSWRGSVYGHTSQVSGNLAACPVKATATELNLQACNMPKGIHLTATNLKCDTLTADFINSSVSGAANLQRVTQCVAKQSGGAGF